VKSLFEDHGQEEVFGVEKIIRRLVRGARRDAGFTLIELLVVIIIIAILAAIAIPTYLGQRQQAQDAAAYTLVRNALTAIQTAFVDTGSYREITPEMLNDLENTTTWLESADDLVATDPPSINDAVLADAGNGEVIFYPQSRTVIDLASRSTSGNWFGIQIDTVDLSESGYVKVKVIDGSADIGW
jgi:prepilin-type N-terminal cleavage/methylation domain-containing protein